MRKLLLVSLVLCLGLLLLTFLLWNVYQKEIRGAFIVAEVVQGLEREHRKTEQGGGTRLWSKSPEDFFDDPKLISLCKSIAEVDDKEGQRLIESGQELNHVGKDGMTVLFVAYFEGNFVAFKQLLEHGALPDFPLNHPVELLAGYYPTNAGDTVLLASCANPIQRVAFYREAIMFTKTPNQRDSLGRTTLHLLLRQSLTPEGMSDLLSPTIESSVDLDAKDNSGRTAEDYAKDFAPSLLPAIVRAKSNQN